MGCDASDCDNIVNASAVFVCSCDANIAVPITDIAVMERFLTILSKSQPNASK